MNRSSLHIEDYIQQKPHCLRVCGDIRVALSRKEGTLLSILFLFSCRHN